MFLAAQAAPHRRLRFFWTGGAPPPPTEIERRAAADTMTSAHSSTTGGDTKYLFLSICLSLPLSLWPGWSGFTIRLEMRPSFPHKLGKQPLSKVTPIQFLLIIL